MLKSARDNKCGSQWHSRYGPFSEQRRTFFLRLSLWLSSPLPRPLLPHTHTVISLSLVSAGTGSRCVNNQRSYSCHISGPTGNLTRDPALVRFPTQFCRPKRFKVLEKHLNTWVTPWTFWSSWKCIYSTLALCVVMSHSGCLSGRLSSWFHIALWEV